MSPRTPGNHRRESGITKLAYQDVRRSQALREALDQHYYGQLSFSPDINPKSRAIGKVRQQMTPRPPQFIQRAALHVSNVHLQGSPFSCYHRFQRHSVEELYRGTPGSTGGNRHGRGAAVSAAVDRETEECVFRPALNRRSLALAEQRRLLKRASSGGGGILDSVQASLELQKVSLTSRGFSNIVDLRNH